MSRAGFLFALAAPFAFTLAGDARADTNAELVAKIVALIEAGASVVDANQNDCNAMGDKLNQMWRDNADFIEHVKARAEKATPDEMRAATARYQTRVEAAAAKAKPGLERCRSNAKVAGVMRKIKE